MFRLRRAKGNLFLMKNGRTAKLLWGHHLMEEIFTGDTFEIPLDWYFSFYFFLLKEFLTLFGGTDPGRAGQTLDKIAEGLEFISKNSPDKIADLTSSSAATIRAMNHGNVDWFDTRDFMLSLFSELTTRTLNPERNDLLSQVDELVKQPKGKSFLKNFEYSVLSLFKHELVRPDRILSRRLIMDRYRAALILLVAAVSREGQVDSVLTSKACRILQGCAPLKKYHDVRLTWEDLRSALFQNWDIAQSVMGL